MFMPPIEFVTERLSLKVWQDRHRAPFAAMSADPAVMRHFPAPLTRGQSDELIDRWLGEFASRGWSYWAVERIESAELIGCIGLSVPRWQFPFGPCVELGWRLRRSAWGSGYATEGAIACLGVGFERIGLDEIVAYASVDNQRSLNVMARAGMRRCEHGFDHPGLPEGHPLRPHRRYALRRADWLERRGGRSPIPG